jgi:hypothetical protein
MSQINALLIVVCLVSFAHAQASATRPTTLPASTPAECVNSFAAAIASGDLDSISKFYRPGDEEAPTPRDLVNWEKAAKTLNDVATAHWGKDSFDFANLPSAEIPRWLKLDLTEQGETAFLSSPNLGHGKPAIRLAKQDGAWHVTHGFDITGEQMRAAMPLLSELADEIKKNKYQNANAAGRMLETRVLKIMGKG